MYAKNLILISGKKRSGKDTFASYFIEKGYRRFGFADDLKDDLEIFLLSILDVPQHQIDFHGDKKEDELGVTFADKIEMTNRNSMQWFGQLMKREFGLYYWTDKVIANINAMETDRDIVIADTRFDFEIDRIRHILGSKYNIFAIRLTRPRYMGGDNDISEISLDEYEGFDWRISNDGDLGELKNKFDIIYNVLK